MNSITSPLGTAKRMMEIALKLDVEQADVYVSSATNLSLEVRNGEVETLRKSASLGLGLRVTLGGRTALVHTTDTSSVALMKLAREAVDIAGALPESKEPTPYAPARLIEGLPHPDPDLQSEPIESKKARLIDVEKAMRSVPGVTSSVAASYSEVDGEIVLVNSRGLELYTPFSRVNVYAECIAGRDDQAMTGGNYVAVSSRSRLPESESIGRKAGERAVALLGGRPIPSTRAAVIFAPQTGWTVLRCLASPLRGDYVVQKRSYLGEQLGRPVAAAGVTIRDNPLLRGGAGSRPFDGEGSPASDVAVIEQGVLRSYLTDLASAETLGVACGGHAVRSAYDARPEIDTSNFYMEPGSSAPEEIIRDTARGMLVTVLSGWWVGISPSTDIFSAAAMGHWIENGEIVHPVRGVTIGGNLRQMIRGIDRIGSDLEFTAETRTPTFRVAEMAISGT